MRERTIGRSRVALVLGTTLAALWSAKVAMAAPVKGAIEGAAPASQPRFASFDEAAAAATVEPDPAALLAPLVYRCDSDDDLARRQCEGLHRFALAHLSDPVVLRGDARSLMAGAYDAKQGGLPLTISGCVVCAAPLSLGEGAAVYLAERPPADVGEGGGARCADRPH